MTPLGPTFGPSFRPRDRVAGDDLTAWQRVPLFAAARHFRGLHRLYGVADGLIVKDEGNGYSVTSGVAFDAYGRPLVLIDEVTPRCHFPLRDGLLVLRGTEPECHQLGVPVPIPHIGRVVLIDRADLQLWDVDVPLAGLKLTQNPATLEFDLGQRAVVVRTFRRPYIATGTVPSGTTAVPLTDKDKPTGWSVWMDTSAAGFLPVAVATESTPAGSPPVYLVTVGRQTTGDAADDAAKLRNGQQVVNDGSTPANEPPTITVSAASPRGFRLTVDYGTATAGLNGLTATPLEIAWTGVEQRVEARNLKRNPDTVKAEGVTVSQTTDRPSYPWPAFRDGQRLQAADLNDLQETVRKLQRLHNRALHDWG